MSFLSVTFFFITGYADENTNISRGERRPLEHPSTTQMHPATQPYHPAAQQYHPAAQPYQPAANEATRQDINRAADANALENSASGVVQEYPTVIQQGYPTVVPQGYPAYPVYPITPQGTTPSNGATINVITPQETAPTPQH